MPFAQLILAEDDPQLRRLMGETLAEKGYPALLAEDGVAGLELLQANPGVSLLLSDVRMPRMDGYDLAGQALALRPELKILLMTGYAGDSPPSELLRAREIRTLVKPFNIEQMCELVGDMLARP